MTERPRIDPFELDPATARIELESSDGNPPPSPIATAEPPPKRHALRLFLGAGAALILALLVLEAWFFVVGLFASSLVLGTGFALLILATAAGAIALVGRELRALMRLARLEAFRREGERLMGSDMHGDAGPLLARIEALYAGRPEVAPLLDAHRAHANDALADGERLHLFARGVLHPLDRHAYREVVKAARNVAGLTAISPLGLLDSAVVLMHTTAMVRRIATLYGVRPGAAGMARLLRRTLRNVLMAGVAELVGDSAVETLGASLTGALSAKAGQGLVNGLLCARLGLVAMELCRPLPFTEADRPRLSRLRRELFG